jgi:sugar phosphate permease
VLGSASMTGMSLLVPGVTWLILTTGWRTTYLFIAAGILVLVLPLCLLVLRDSPESVGLLADGATPRVGTSPDSIERGDRRRGAADAGVLAARGLVLHRADSR